MWFFVLYQIRVSLYVEPETKEYGLAYPGFRVPYQDMYVLSVRYFRRRPFEVLAQCGP